MAIINKSNLEHYLSLNYNVLFRGRHGVGKTEIIKEVFNKAGLRWKYFSSSTLDPWVDFVGLPRVKDHPDGRSTAELIRPSFIENDEVEAIFFDEYNRAPDKVLNATMELIQFGSINGHKLKNLKVIWAAINPEDDEDTYSVNHLDPAHIDRFQVQIDVPYKLDEEYFMKKYPDFGRTFMDWWKSMPQETQFLVSPRRLDFAAHAYQNECRLEDFLPYESNVRALRNMLKAIPFLEQINAIKTDAEAADFLKDVNNTARMLDMIKNAESTAIQFFTTYGAKIPRELQAPFIDYLQARKEGFEYFDSIEEMIDKLPGDRGTTATGAQINNVDLRRMFAKSGGNLTNDILALHKIKPNMVQKLANRVSDILQGSQVETIKRLFWGIQGKEANQPTNLQLITLELSTIPGLFSVKQKQNINTKLYRNKIVDDMNFLG